MRIRVKRSVQRSTGVSPVSTTGILPVSGRFCRSTGVPPVSGRFCRSTGVSPVSTTGVPPVSSDRERSTEAPIDKRQGARLPHWTQAGATYAVTFRLADSMPAHVLESWIAQRKEIVERAEQQKRELTHAERTELHMLYSARVQSYLDAGQGECLLRDPRVAGMVHDALKHFDGERYELVAWCVMPNHVHIVMRPLGTHELSDILHSWKSFTAKEINRILGRSGQVWQEEYYDHLIRDEQDLHAEANYILDNPGKAGLADWPWKGIRVSQQQDHGQDARGMEETARHGQDARATEETAGHGQDARGTHGQDARATEETARHGQDARATEETARHGRDARDAGGRDGRTAAGLTLIELIVAMGILVIIISLVGFVFNEVSKAVELTDRQLERDVGLQALAQRLGQDIQNINREGFLCIVQGEPVTLPGGGFGGYSNPPAIVFTATGRFVAPSNTNITSNAALIAYVPCREIAPGVVAAPAAMVSAVGRYAYLLGVPAPDGAPNLPAPLDSNDSIRASLADVTALAPIDTAHLAAVDSLIGPMGLWTLCVSPFVQNLSSLGLTNVNGLWPYVVGGYRNIQCDVELTYGPDPATGQMIWRTPQQAWTDTQGASPPDPNQAISPGRVPLPRQRLPELAPYSVIWTGRDKTVWPRAIRLTLTMYDTEGVQVGPPAELVFDIPQ